MWSNGLGGTPITKKIEMLFSLFYKNKNKKNKMLKNRVPSLQAIIIANLSHDIIDEISKLFVLPKLATLKERINIRVLGTDNPVKFVTDYMLNKEINKRFVKQFGYIHQASSVFNNQSPRTRRLNKPTPEKRRINLSNNSRYTKTEFYDYYYYDHNLAKKYWNEAEERTDPEGSNNTYTKHEFYDYYKSKKITEFKWGISNKITYRSGYNYQIEDATDYDRLSDIY